MPLLWQMRASAQTITHQHSSFTSAQTHNKKPMLGTKKILFLVLVTGCPFLLFFFPSLQKHLDCQLGVLETLLCVLPRKARQLPLCVGKLRYNK
jgi:ABC-type Fe3+ transport system permease subunit